MQSKQNSKLKTKIFIYVLKQNTSNNYNTGSYFSDFNKEIANTLGKNSYESKSLYYNSLKLQVETIQHNTLIQKLLAMNTQFHINLVNEIINTS